MPSKRRAAELLESLPETSVRSLTGASLLRTRDGSREQIEAVWLRTEASGRLSTSLAKPWFVRSPSGLAHGYGFVCRKATGSRKSSSIRR